RGRGGCGSDSPEGGPVVQTATVLSFAIVAAVDAAVLGLYVAVRRRLLKQEVDRTPVYAGLIVAIFATHQFTVAEILLSLDNAWRLPVALLEAAAVVAVVVAYPPLRRRSAEALCYLMGGCVRADRKSTRLNS